MPHPPTTRPPRVVDRRPEKVAPDTWIVCAPCAQEFAPQWTLIAKKVSDAFACERTAASVRNYYKRFEASKQTALRGFAKNRCQLCNQIKRGHICKVKLSQGILETDIGQIGRGAGAGRGFIGH